MDDKAGYGWVTVVNGTIMEVESNPIGKHVHIYNAELIAIQSALVWLLDNPHHLTCGVCIRSDLQLVLKEICSRQTANKLIQEVIDLLEDLRLEGPISLEWVKGHSGDQSNDLKEGSQQVDLLKNCPTSHPSHD